MKLPGSDKKFDCPVCGNQMKYRFKKFKYRFYQCKNCDFGKFIPLPERDDILSRYTDKYFAEEYLPSYGVSEDSFNPEVLKKFDFIDQLLKKNNYFSGQKPGKALDIGCGGGFLLKNLKDKGWDVLGIDIIDSSIHFSKDVLKVDAEKMNIDEIDISLLIKKYGKFDLILLTDALEHFFHPEKIIKIIHEILNEDGVIFVTIPNIKSISFKFIGKEWSIISPLEHISYFSKDSLKILFQSAGFSDIRTYYLQYVNMSNIHKRTVRYYLSKLLLFIITKWFNIAFEGREFYDEVLKGDHFKPGGAKGAQGDVLIGIGKKSV